MIDLLRSVDWYVFPHEYIDRERNSIMSSYRGSVLFYVDITRIQCMPFVWHKHDTFGDNALIEKCEITTAYKSFIEKPPAVLFVLHRPFHQANRYKAKFSIFKPSSLYSTLISEHFVVFMKQSMFLHNSSHWIVLSISLTAIFLVFNISSKGHVSFTWWPYC